MHFPIIEIMSKKKAQDIPGPSIFEDATLEYHTDYYGEEYTEKERMDVLTSEWFNKMFDGIGEVCPKEGIIRIFDEDTVRRTLNRYFEDVLESLADLKEEKIIWRKFYGLRNAGEEYKHNSTLFFFDGYGCTSMQFMEDIIYHAGKELYIYNIYDAHC